jgi:hypothetical protein
MPLALTKTNGNEGCNVLQAQNDPSEKAAEGRRSPKRFATTSVTLDPYAVSRPRHMRLPEAHNGDDGAQRTARPTAGDLVDMAVRFYWIRKNSWDAIGLIA